MKKVVKNSVARATAIVIGAGLMGADGARADQVIPEDLIVQGSTCVGFDCVNDEVFGFNTLMLKENNLRIFFNDTSAQPGFTTNKWSIVANDSTSDGANFLGFEDTTAGWMPFKVMAGARANALVAQGNRVGIGTDNPFLTLHMLSNDTPAIRMEQDNSGGFGAQTWDIGANEANFFVRDSTGGSRLPFRIRPGAPTSSLDISANGFVGIGTPSPQANLHVSSAATPVIQIESTAPAPGIKSKWSISSAPANGIFAVRDALANTVPFKITPGAPNNAILIKANGGLQFGTLLNCTNGIRTNAAGILSCMPVPSPSAAEVAGSGPGATLASYNPAGIKAVDGEDGASSPHESEKQEAKAAAAGCADGDIAGSWSMFGTNIEDAGANSVLWCDVQFSKIGKAPAKYSINGVCRSHATNAAVPQNYVVNGDRSISVTPACKFSGNFTIKQGNRTAVTATILEGRIEGTGDSKTRAVGVSRWPRGKTFALQTFTMQR